MGVADDPPRRLHPRSHEKGRPVDGMEAKDVLAHQVSRGRPAVGGVGVARYREVVSEGIQPDIHLEEVNSGGD